MSSTKYVGRIILSVSGVPVDVESIKPDRDLKREAVPTMNETGNSKGNVEGVPEYNISLVVPIPKTGDLYWDGIRDGNITIYDRLGIVKEQYFGVFTKKVSPSYELQGVSKRNIDMGAERFVQY